MLYSFVIYIFLFRMVSVVVYTGEFIEDSSTWPDNAQIVKVTVAYANALFNTTQQIQGSVL